MRRVKGVCSALYSFAATVVLPPGLGTAAAKEGGDGGRDRGEKKDTGALLVGRCHGQQPLLSVSRFKHMSVPR